MQYEIPETTPWGDPDYVRELAPGIIHFMTPGHGGLYVCPEVNEKVPLKIKMASFLGNGFLGWYEEDCDMAMILGHFDLSTYD